VDKKSNTPVTRKFRFAEAVRLLVAAKVCSGYTYWGLAPLTTHSIGTPPQASPLKELPATTGKNKAPVTTWKTVTLETAKQGVKAYNELKWTENGITRSNVDIDNEAHDVLLRG
jgi:hypothetical protein